MKEETKKTKIALWSGYALRTIVALVPLGIALLASILVFPLYLFSLLTKKRQNV